MESIVLGIVSAIGLVVTVAVGYLNRPRTVTNEVGTTTIYGWEEMLIPVVASITVSALAVVIAGVVVGQITQ